MRSRVAARAAALVCFVGALAGCLPAADPSGFAAPSGVDGVSDVETPVEAPKPASSALAPADEVAALSAPGVDARQRRRAREMTVRIRATGCGELATGSGFVIGDRLIVTNRHVVDGAGAVSINTWDGRSVDATVQGVDLSDDIAVMRVDRELPASAQLADADPGMGDEVTAVGFPLGGRQALSSGTVVDYARLDTGDGPRIMRVSAEIWPGSSGGPLVDLQGRVVGVVFALERATDYGLAIPVSDLRDALAQGTTWAASPGC